MDVGGMFCLLALFIAPELILVYILLANLCNASELDLPFLLLLGPYVLLRTWLVRTLKRRSMVHKAPSSGDP